MGSELGEQQIALGKSLGDELEVQHLQVSQAPVHELARAAGCSFRPILRFDDRRREAAARGIQGDPCTGDAPTDDQHVEFLTGTDGASQSIQCVCP